MFNNAKLFSLYALTPVHPGSGTSLSYVDLPIQREKNTSFPVIPGSAIKGVIRDLALRVWDREKVNLVFGSEDTGDQASYIAFTDAKILFYPVRSVRGVFAYITCPFVINRFIKEIGSIDGKKVELNINLPKINDEEIIISNNSELIIKDFSKTNNQNITSEYVCLEEFSFNVKKNDQIIQDICGKLKEYIPDQGEFQKKLAIVSDNVFTDLVNYAVDVRTRIKINQETGIVEQGALFVTEFVPSEAIFYSFVLFNSRVINRQDSDKEIAEFLKDLNTKITDLLRDKMLQIGGDETIGSGIVKLYI